MRLLSLHVARQEVQSALESKKGRPSHDPAEALLEEISILEQGFLCQGQEPGGTCTTGTGPRPLATWASLTFSSRMGRSHLFTVPTQYKPAALNSHGIDQISKVVSDLSFFNIFSTTKGPEGHSLQMQAVALLLA